MSVVPLPPPDSAEYPTRGVTGRRKHTHLYTVGREAVYVEDALCSLPLLFGRGQKVSHHRVSFHPVNEDRHRYQAALFHYPAHGDNRQQGTRGVMDGRAYRVDGKNESTRGKGAKTRWGIDNTPSSNR